MAWNSKVIMKDKNPITKGMNTDPYTYVQESCKRNTMLEKNKVAERLMDKRRNI